MKKVILGALFAGTMFASCSNDGPDGDPGTGNIGDGSQAYMNIRISMSDSGAPGAKAGADGGTENGTDAEQKVSSLILKFYDAAGNFYGYGDPVELQEIKRPAGAAPGAQGNQIEGYIGSIVALTINEGDAKPSYIVAYINCNAKQTPEPAITDISKTVSGVCGSENTDFLMTSSNYYRDLATATNNYNGYATVISDDKFFKSADEARRAAENNGTDHFVNIYVERLAAKVAVKNEAIEDPTKNVPVEPNSGYKLAFNYTGYSIGGINTDSYLIKNIEDFNETTPWNGWNDIADHRSYWAKDVNYTYSIPTSPALGYVSYNNGYNNGSKLYCAENTFDAVAEVNPYLVQPFVYVFGYYTVTKGGTPVTDAALYEYAGNIYPASEIINVIQNSLGAFLFKKTTETGADGTSKDVYTPEILTEADVDIVSRMNDDIKTGQKDASRVMLKLKDSYTLAEDAYVLNVEATGDTDRYVKATKGNIDAWLAKQKLAVNGFKKDDGGRYPVYFPVLIEHLNWNSGAAGTVGAFGMVRNHVYRITITEIMNLGVGIYDPDVEIIPHKDVKKQYLAAKINVNSWKAVTQTVKL